jgi:host cell factor
MLVFGGHRYSDGRHFAPYKSILNSKARTADYINDTFIFDVEEGSWQKIAVSGDLPEGRYGHSAAIVEKWEPKMIIAGGRGEGGKLFRDLHVLDIQRKEWSRISISTVERGPEPRYFGTMVSVTNCLVPMGTEQIDGEVLVLFGGKNHKTCFNDLWVFDWEAQRRQRQKRKIREKSKVRASAKPSRGEYRPEPRWLVLPAAGLPPPPQWGHTMLVLPDGNIWIASGITAKEVSDKMEVMLLDSTTMIWHVPRLPRITGKRPSRRALYSACLAKDYIFIFGGCVPSYDIDAREGDLECIAEDDDFLATFQWRNRQWSSPILDSFEEMTGDIDQEDTMSQV